jgi:lactoylglutathione lyase
LEGDAAVKLTKVDYVILYVRDLDASTAFYRDAVGLPHRFTDNGYAEFATEGTKFSLFDRSGVRGLIGREPSEGGPSGEVAFIVDDVDAHAERLRKAGVQILSGPENRSWGQRTLHFLDPDGNVVEFAQEISREETLAEG